MIRNIKALGLAFLAMAAIGALAASVAQAQEVWPVHITTEEDKAVITGHAENEVLTVGAQTVQCKTATLEGTVKQATHASQLTATEIHATPTYQECTGFGGIAVTVQMNGCTYTIVSTTTKLTAEGGVTGCTPEKQIVIKSQICTITIGNQTGDLSHITLTNDAEKGTEKHHLQDHVTVQGIQFTRDGFFCPNAESAEYKGTTTIKAYKDVKDVEVEKHGHKYLEHVDNKEVEFGILAT